MVFGPLLDAMAARREGSSTIHVLTRGNQLVASRLPWKSKVVFWLSNAPYHMLAWQLIFGAAPKNVPGAQWMHALAAAVVALASTCFHGAVLFSGSSKWPQRLLAFDLLAANGYGAVLAMLLGLWRVLAAFAPPLVLLMSSAYLKRKGHILSYAALHGTWHVLSAAAMWRCLYGEV